MFAIVINPIHYPSVWTSITNVFRTWGMCAQFLLEYHRGQGTYNLHQFSTWLLGKHSNCWQILMGCNIHTYIFYSRVFNLLGLPRRNITFLARQHFSLRKVLALSHHLTHQHKLLDPLIISDMTLIIRSHFTLLNSSWRTFCLLMVFLKAEYQNS